MKSFFSRRLNGNSESVFFFFFVKIKGNIIKPLFHSLMKLTINRIFFFKWKSKQTWEKIRFVNASSTNLELSFLSDFSIMIITSFLRICRRCCYCIDLHFSLFLVNLDSNVWSEFWSEECWSFCPKQWNTIVLEKE